MHLVACLAGALDAPRGRGLLRVALLSSPSGCEFGSKFIPNTPAIPSSSLFVHVDERDPAIAYDEARGAHGGRFTLLPTRTGYSRRAFQREQRGERRRAESARFATRLHAGGIRAPVDCSTAPAVFETTSANSHRCALL